MNIPDRQNFFLEKKIQLYPAKTKSRSKKMSFAFKTERNLQVRVFP